jgi:hypothetical protein
MPLWLASFFLISRPFHHERIRGSALPNVITIQRPTNSHLLTSPNVTG